LWVNLAPYGGKVELKRFVVLNFLTGNSQGQVKGRGLNYQLNFKKSMKTITFQGVFDTPSVKMGNINELGVTPDGRTWEYVRASEIITSHMIVATPDNTDVDTVSSSDDADGNTIYVTEAAAGWTVGVYQDKWMLVDSGTGVGQVAKIKDNTATTLELYLDYALATDLAVADSDILIIPTTYVEKSPVTNVYTPCRGVAQATFAANDYGWFLKKGMGGVTMGEAPTVERAITPGDDTEGYGAIVDDGDDFYDATIIGYCLGASDTADVDCVAQINVL